MKDPRSKKTIAAGLSLTLALGSVPAVAFADNAGEGNDGAAAQQGAYSVFVFSAIDGEFDGDNVAFVEANEDGSVNAPTPTRAGYTFKGWYSASNIDQYPAELQDTYKLDPSNPSSPNWFAAWEKNATQSIQVVNFFQDGERDGSDETINVEVTADSSVADCIKSFDGYTAQKVVAGVATSEVEVNMTSSLEGITTLYVYYKADKAEEQDEINVLYVANGGQFLDGNETMQGVADADGMLRQPPAPTREGYTFAGWYWHADLSQYTDEQKEADKVDFSKPVEKSAPVYAQWIKNQEQNEIDVLYVANGGQFADGQDVQQGLTDSEGYMRQPMTPTREGYTFAGWYWVSSLDGLTDEQKELNKVNFAQPVTKPHATMYAQWVKNAEQNEINVLYVANGGQFADGNDTMMGMTDSEGFMRQPAAPTREGYTFAGWYWHQDLSQYTDEQKEADKVDFAESVAGMDHATMYAQWTKNAEQNEIDVMYVANGGQFATGETFQQGITDADGFMRQPAAPTREGYTFAGWYWVSSLDGLTDEQKDLNKVDFEQSVAGKDHVTMFAQWTKDAEQENLFNVMYVANGGEFFTGETFQQGVTDSEGVMRQPAAPTREGYTFDGWYWHADLSQYTAEQKALDKVDFTAPIDRDATMYAQWSKVVTPAEKKITVKFVDNFNKTESTVEINEGEAVAQPMDPSYKGWSFEGWSSTLTDEQGNAKFTPVDFSKVVADEDEDGVVTYYAFYTEDKKSDAAEEEQPKQEIDPDTGKDKYQTDPVPEGKPAPSEPQDTTVDQTTTYTCTISISCDTILNNWDAWDEWDAETAAAKKPLVPADGVILSATTASFSEGESVYDVLQRVCRENGIHMEASWTPMYNSAYVEGINNLYEFDVSQGSGWMYRVNGWFPNYGCSRYALQNGDVVEWVYTCDLGYDVGGGYVAG